jgi:hypothetical protein
MRVMAVVSRFVLFTMLAAHPHALVIGNRAYQNVPVLPNPLNDATEMAASLQRTTLSTMICVARCSS